MKIAIKLLFRYLMNNKKKMIFLAISMLILMLSMVSIPMIIGMSIDKISSESINFSGLYIVLAIFAGLTFLRCISSLITNWLQENVFCSFVFNIRKDVFDKMLYMDTQKFETYSRGDLLSRIINDVDTVSNVLRQGISSLIIGTSTVVTTLFIVFVFSWRLGLILVAFTPFGLFMTKFISESSYKYFKKTAILRGKLYSYTEEMIATLKESKNFNVDKLEKSKFDLLQKSLYESGVLGQFYSSLPNPAMRFINAMIYLIVTMFCAYLVIVNSISVGLMVAFLKYTNQYIEPFNDITQVITQLQSAIACLERINTILLIDDESDTVPTGYKFAGKIVIDRMSFSYDEKPFMKNINLTIPEKSRVALVGKSGCGKTTLVNILMGMYNTEKGTILYDDIDIKNISKKNLRENISFVMQDSFIMNASVRDNIKYGRECSDDEMIEASKKAYAHDFIMMLPKGYDTVLDENGTNLSQGEKQLICIARAMIKMPSIVILDEATSDIDTRSELHIKKAFDRMLENRTSIIVAHRLSTIKNSDIIIVMDEGKIVELGTHENLMKLGGEYYSLNRAMYE